MSRLAAAPPGVRPGGPAGHTPQTRPARDPRLDLVRAFARLYMEVEAGRRPPATLFRLMDAKLVRRLSGRWVRGASPGRVRRVRGVVTGPRRFDAVAVVERSGRAGALLVELARDDLGWRVVDVARPEHAAAA